MNPWIPVLLAALSSAQPETLVVPMPTQIVTGTRARESFQRAPAAVSVVPRSQFNDSRMISLQDALSSVPGVFVQNRDGAQDVRVTIRGFGARGNGERSNAGSMRGIRVLTDGIPASDPDGRTNLDMIDIGGADRIEISRSNASALYGNASGGVIQLRSNLSFDKPFVEVDERAGSYGFHREQGRVGFLAGSARGTFTLSNSTYEGWRKHSNSYTTRGSLKLAMPLADASRLLLMADASSNYNEYAGALTASQLAADREQADATFVSRHERRFHRVGRVAAALDHAISDRQTLTATAFVEPRVQQRSERNRFRDFTRYHVGGSTTWSLDWNAAPGVTARTLVGGDEAWQDGSILFWNLRDHGARGTTQVANKREGANSAGAFVQQSLTWNEAWTAQVAARYDNLWYVSEDYLTPKLGATKHFTQVTPKASVSWTAGAHTVFAALGGGVEAPAFNEIDPPAPFDTITSFNPFLEPMRSTTYELGSRGSITNGLGTWRYDAAAYWIDVQDDIVSYGGGAYFRTAGKTRRQGLEAALDWQPVGALWVRGGGTVAKNEYDEWKNDAGDFSGNDMPGLPKLTWFGTVRYTMPQGVAAQVSLNGAGKYFADDANISETIGYGVVDASLSYDARLNGKGVRAFVAGSNLLDKEYIGSVFINGINSKYFQPGLPRNFSGGVTLRW